MVAAATAMVGETHCRRAPPATKTSTPQIEEAALVTETSNHREVDLLLRLEAHERIRLAARRSDAPAPAKTTTSSRCRCDWRPQLARLESAPPRDDQCPATTWPSEEAAVKVITSSSSSSHLAGPAHRS